ncbi:MAG: glycerol-3-phosphate 1-O-acyltransferase PlsY [Planctomycetales bacterium]
MPLSPYAVGLIATAYLTGSVPFGYLCGRLVHGIDIREHGSGNLGATNVGRVLGGRWGALVFLFDGLKGFLPVWLAAPLFLGGDNPDLVHWQVAAGGATIVGHMFPCWLGFRGGKGVATSLGVVLCLGGWSTLIAAGAFLASFALKRIVSLSSIVAAVVFAVSQMIFLKPQPFSPSNWSLGVFSLLVPLLIIVRHRGNILRLVRGEEPRYEFGKKD